jgi:hypothetical protein
MFPLSFPYSLLKKAKKGDVVYDPFCGRGTTNYAARLLGLKSIGVDSNPVAHAIAQAKLVNVRPRDVISLCKEIVINTKISEIPNSEFWDRAYHPLTLIDINKARTYFFKKTNLSQNDIALRAIILGVLHGPLMLTQSSYLSNQMPRTFSTKPDYSINYWKKKRLRPRYVDLVDLVEKKTRYIFNTETPAKTQGRILLGDSRNISDQIEQNYNWIITSPPYFGMSTYEQDQWLRNWFMGGSDKVDYSRNYQINHGSEDIFIKDLSNVWIETAKKSKVNGNLIIRFGALPSKSERTPVEIIKDSLILSNCGWRIKTIRNAGKPIDSKRQANQFKNKTGRYIEEIDVYATLDT